MSHALLRLEDSSMEQLFEQIRQIRGRSDSTLLTYPELLKVLLCWAFEHLLVMLKELLRSVHSVAFSFKLDGSKSERESLVLHLRSDILARRGDGTIDDTGISNSKVLLLFLFFYSLRDIQSTRRSWANLKRPFKNWRKCVEMWRPQSSLKSTNLGSTTFPISRTFVCAWRFDCFDTCYFFVHMCLSVIVCVCMLACAVPACTCACVCTCVRMCVCLRFIRRAPERLLSRHSIYQKMWIGTSWSKILFCWQQSASLTKRED